MPTLDTRYKPKYCRSELGRRMCALPFGHETHRAEDGVEWTTDARVTYEQAVAWAAKDGSTWTAAPLLALIYGKTPREVRSDIRNA